jgi:hypothetical protein
MERIAERIEQRLKILKCEEFQNEWRKFFESDFIINPDFTFIFRYNHILGPIPWDYMDNYLKELNQNLRWYDIVRSGTTQSHITNGS